MCIVPSDSRSPRENRLRCVINVFVTGVHLYSMENPCKYHNDAKCTTACKQFRNLPHGYCRGDHCECSTQARAVVESAPDPCQLQDVGACVVSCTGVSFDMGHCVEQVCHCLNMNGEQPGTRLSEAKAAASKQKAPSGAAQPELRVAVDGGGHRKQPQHRKRVIGSSQETYVPLLDLLSVPKALYDMDPCRTGTPEQCRIDCGKLKYDRSSCVFNVCRCSKTTTRS
ncbi:uncharacterized protein LOC142563545 isoform X1 [Dermacentor variabilis]|uniref:uncharacterized protein LOC142563545 isoform X1 n=1 Tax=Dermacentor variabilis TaxID=34621 RepID=UPI003F5C698C